MKIAYDLPRQCRTFIVDHYLANPLQHIREMIIRRYVQFIQKLTTSSNPVIWSLSNLAVTTVRSTTGSNVSNIRQEFGMDPLQTYKKLFSVKKATIPEDGLQTIELLDYLLFIRRQENATCDTDGILEDLEQTIVQTCTS